MAGRDVQARRVGVAKMPNSSSRIRIARLGLPWIGLLVSGIFSYLAVRHVRFSDVWIGLRGSNYWWLIPAFGVLALAAGIVITVLAVAVYGARPLRWVLQPLARLPGLSRTRVEQAADNLTTGLASLRSARLALGALFWTTLGWLTLGVSTWLLML